MIGELNLRSGRIVMGQKQGLTHELKERKLRIVKLLAIVFILIGVVAFLDYLVIFIIHPERLAEPLYIFSWILITVLIIFFAYVRFRLIYKSLELSFTLIIAAFLVGAFVVMFLVGTTSTIPYLIFVITILCSSVILSVTRSWQLFFAIAILTGIIFLLHITETIAYTPSDTSSTIASTVIYMLFIGVVGHIAKVAYGQIEHSYQKAFDYAKELETLNVELDNRVKLRTDQLETSFRKRAESVHNAAVMGSIAIPLLHDLANPLSSLKGTFKLLEEKKYDKETDELVKMSKQAVDQAIRVVGEGRQLMKKQEAIREFSPYELVSVVILISKSELLKNKINVNVDIDPNIRMQGMSSLFERIVVNIVLNAIEELKNTDKKRVVDIKGKIKGKYFILSIRDSGRGISKSILKKIFTPEFSYKKDAGHLGLGLPFVKSAIESNFGGEIEVKSIVGKYTEFILSFSLKDAQS